MEIKNKKIKKMKKIENKDQEKILRKQKKLTAKFMVNKETLIQIKFQLHLNFLIYLYNWFKLKI